MLEYAEEDVHNMTIELLPKELWLGVVMLDLDVVKPSRSMSFLNRRSM
jgi:hypothetical protein